MSQVSLSKRRLGLAACATLVGVTAALLPFAPAGATSGTISGVAFDDADRDGLRDPGEAPFAGHRLYLFDGARTRFVSAQTTDANGAYVFTGLAAGTYLLEYETSTYGSLRNDWVPTTTGSLQPQRTVSAGSTADFGWRRIVRSTSIDAPLSTFTAPNGLRVQSYNDAVPASAVWSALGNASLMGPEAATTKVYFDFGSATDAVTSVNGSPGNYSGFTASLWIGYLSWVDTYDHVLFHEYGHAWAEYHAHITQQDPSMASYLQARGVAGDPRIGSSKGWDPHEMLAEDWRLLFGSATAAAYPQMNSDLPHATDVAGLREFLRDTYTHAPSSPPPPPPSGDPAPTATPVDITSVVVTPTPISKSGSVKFTLSTAATATVEILSSSGAVVRTLVSTSPMPAGESSIRWDRKDARGRRVPAGTYVARVQAQGGGSSDTAQSAFQVA